MRLNQTEFRVISKSEIGTIHKLVKAEAYWDMKEKIQKEILTDIIPNENGTISVKDLEAIALILSDFEDRLDSLEHSRIYPDGQY